MTITTVPGATDHVPRSSADQFYDLVPASVENRVVAVMDLRNLKILSSSRSLKIHV